METFFVTKVSVINFKIFLSAVAVLDEWQAVFTIFMTNSHTQTGHFQKFFFLRAFLC